MSLDPLSNPIQDNTVQEIKFPKTKKNVGKLVKPHMGMTLWGIVPETGEIEEVKFKATSLPRKEETKRVLPKFAGALSKKSQLTLEHETITHLVDAKEGVFYIWAINKKNALRKYRKAFKRETP